MIVWPIQLLAGNDLRLVLDVLRWHLLESKFNMIVVRSLFICPLVNLFVEALGSFVSRQMDNQ